MYVARLRRTGVRGLARPCERCEKELIEFGVRQMVWTIDERSFGTTMLQQDSSTNDLTNLLESALLCVSTKGGHDEQTHHGSSNQRNSHPHRM
jgi:hypothetical protein